MNIRKLSIIPVTALLMSVITIPAARAATNTVVVTPASSDWNFYNDDVVGVGVGELAAGPAPTGFGTGSAHFTLDATARMALGNYQYAGTRLDQISYLAYSTYNSPVTLQFNVDYDLTDSNTSWQGRLVHIPGTTTPNTWMDWTDLTHTGTWWASGTPGNTHCPQGTPCTWAQVLSYWPNAGIRVSDGGIFLKAGGPAPAFDGNADKLVIGVNGNTTTYDFEPGPAQLGFQVFPGSTSLISVGGVSAMLVNLNSVSNLYGYQFKVHYDNTRIHATAMFFSDVPGDPGVSAWFTKTNSITIPGWQANCNDATGMCSFAASKQRPGVPINGSGRLALIQFTGISAGVANLSFSDDVLSTINGFPIAHGKGTGTVTVYGTASASGNVTLQGRNTPYDAIGKVTLTDLDGNFPPIVAPVSASGAWSAASVPVLPSGSNYQLDAAHSLYLGNRLAHTFSAGEAYAAAATNLLGGDANNSGKVEIGDITCIGSDFNGTPHTCGATGSSDINADGTTNIQDLSIAGGNYDLATPQPW